MRSLTSAHSRKRPALITTTFRISKLVAYEGFDCILWNMEGWKWSLSTAVDNGTFTCIEGKGSTQCRAWGLGGCVADRPPAPRWGRRVHIKTPQWGFKKRANAPPRDNTTNTHNKKNGGDICNEGNCGISIVIIYILRHSSFWRPFHFKSFKNAKICRYTLTSKWQRTRSISFLVKTFVKNIKDGKDMR